MGWAEFSSLTSNTGAWYAYGRLRPRNPEKGGMVVSICLDETTKPSKRWNGGLKKPG